MKNKKAVIVQCRLSSTRLPQKALKDLNGKPVLAWVLNAMKQVKADKYYVATDEESYETLKPICEENGFEIFAGDLNNVLKRFCDLIRKIKVDIVIRATADNPFLFYEAAQSSLEEFEKRLKKTDNCDYLTFTGLPHGSGVEIINAASLLKAEQLTDSSYDREHVGPALYNHTDTFTCDFVKAPSRFYYPELRTTIDTYTDYLRAISIVNYIKSNSECSEPFTTEQITTACLSSFIKNPLLFVPSVKSGHGTGHLHRCIKAAIESKSFIFIPENPSLEETYQIIEEYKNKGLEDYQVISELPDESFSPVLVTDLFSMTKEDVTNLKKYKSVISLDEGSDYSDYCDYLMDIIPSVNIVRDANLTDSSFIEKPKNVKIRTDKQYDNILICIGGEDPSGLTVPAAKILSGIFKKAKIFAISKDYEKLENQKSAEEENISFIPPVENLKEKLFQYDLVVTHYGFTAFEAAFAGCAVIMVATTKLHEQLAMKYNYAYIPFKKLSELTMLDALASDRIYPEKNISSEENSLGKTLLQLASGKRMNCPICQEEVSEPDEIISRNKTRTYRRCKKCGLIYMSWTCEPEKNYGNAYFFEDYKKQYGKTYKEDFDSIKKQCLSRISNIISLKKVGMGKNVLDIGCAYGPFLAAAAEKGENPFGTDISTEAIEYIKSELHFPATSAAFPEIDTTDEFGVPKFDAVTMWYVIEHFKNLKVVLTKVNELLKKDGIFAFSTPSGEGVSAVSNTKQFYINSPIDHYSIWEPSKANKVLKKFGFEVVKTVSTGHHPERFPAIQKTGAQKGSLQWNAIEKLSHAKKLGDTVEIYCRKIKDL